MLDAFRDDPFPGVANSELLDKVREDSPTPGAIMASLSLSNHDADREKWP